MKYLIAALALAAQVQAAEPTLNDLPAIMHQLRGCTNTISIWSSNCRLAEDDIWASVHSGGKITLFYKYGGWSGSSITGSGATVSEALRDLAAQVEGRRIKDKALLDSLGPYLPTQ